MKIFIYVYKILLVNFVLLVSTKAKIYQRSINEQSTKKGKILSSFVKSESKVKASWILSYNSTYNVENLTACIKKCHQIGSDECHGFIWTENTEVLNLKGRCETGKCIANITIQGNGNSEIYLRISRGTVPSKKALTGK